MNRKRGFSFLETLAALAILAVVAAALSAPLYTLTASTRAHQDAAAAWDAAESRLVAFWLDDPEAASEATGFTIRWDDGPPETAAGWIRLRVTPENRTVPAAEIQVRAAVRPAVNG